MNEYPGRISVCLIHTLGENVKKKHTHLFKELKKEKERRDICVLFKIQLLFQESQLSLQ